jgi:RNA polymerase sigma-70 factor (ECF subfamily)
MKSSEQDECLKLLTPAYQRLWRFALATTHDHVDAQDLLSETVVEAFERFHTLRDRQAFVGFLFTIATRIQRHKERRAKWFGSYDELAAMQLPSGEGSPEMSAEIRLLIDALEKLPIKEREAVVLFELSGFTLQEIRAIQSGTLSGVKSRLRRGRVRLAGILGVHPEEVAIERRLKRQAERRLPQELSFARDAKP